MQFGTLVDTFKYTKIGEYQSEKVSSFYSEIIRVLRGKEDIIVAKRCFDGIKKFLKYDNIKRDTNWDYVPR